LHRLWREAGLQHVPAVMCSADAMPGDRERALAEGFVGYWTKPIDVRRLAADVEAAIAVTPP
jgi:CheY-like chemotaxis protein